MKKCSVYCKFIRLILVVSLLMCTMGGCSNNNAQDDVVDSVDTLTPTALPATGDQLSKDETVYVLCSPDGGVSKIITSDWLKNGTKENTVAD